MLQVTAILGKVDTAGGASQNEASTRSLAERLPLREGEDREARLLVRCRTHRLCSEYVCNPADVGRQLRFNIGTEGKLRVKKEE